MKSTAAKALSLSALLVTGAFLPAAAETIKVGSKSFTEQFILGEMYAAVLEDAGFTVDRKINLGGTLIAHQALTTGQIDLYPEYTSTGLAAVKKVKVAGDADQVYNEVKDYYAKEFNITWLAQSGVNNGYVLLVRADQAAEKGLKTVSDLAKVNGALVFGGGPEFRDREDGLPGIKRVYGVEFKDFKQFAKLGLRYDALDQGDIDITNGYTTDWQVGTDKVAMLDDDKHLFPPSYVAPIVRQEVLDKNPEIAGLLEKVGSNLDNATMRALNAKVEVDREEPQDVAVAFLKEKGLIK